LWTHLTVIVPKLLAMARSQFLTFPSLTG
jgi:hypothetical protein